MKMREEIWGAERRRRGERRRVFEELKGDFRCVVPCDTPGTPFDAGLTVTSRRAK
jgi:hypothetical protein